MSNSTKSRAREAQKTVDEFLAEVAETFDPWLKSRQAFDVLDEERDGQDEQRHNDGERMHKEFEMTPIFKHLHRAGRRDHSVAGHPQALAHLISHLEKWEKWELGKDNPDLDHLPRLRRGVLEWLREDDERTRRLRTGGTDLLIHGEQGTTKTTLMHWLTVAVMQITPWENVIWQSTLDDCEWLTLGKFATVCLPAGVDVEVEMNPYVQLEDTGKGETVDVDLSLLCREVIRYRNVEDLFRKLSKRTAGQFYVVYPDPRFRQCEKVTGFSYSSVFDDEIARATEATDLSHFWFAFYEQLVHSPDYGEWTTVIGDEVQKYLHQRASSDDHDWWEKVQQWAITHGDARKKRVSFFGSCHKWPEVHGSVRDKMRWAATMNGEDFPTEAPLNGSNTDQTLGETVIWSSQKWNKVGYPDMKRHASVPADFEVSYPDWEEVKDAKSR